MARNGLSAKKGHSAGISAFYTKSLKNRVFIAEICLIKFKLDIEL